VILIEEMEVN